MCLKCREKGKILFHNMSRSSHYPVPRGHIADKGVTWSRVALAKKHWRSGKWEKVKEKCWKITEKKKKRREGKVGKSRGPQACYTISQTSLEFCLPCPVHFCTKSDHVRTVSKKRCKIEQSEHRILTTTEDNRCSTCSGRFVSRSVQMGWFS